MPNNRLLITVGSLLTVKYLRNYIVQLINTIIYKLIKPIQYLLELMQIRDVYIAVLLFIVITYKH